MTAVQLRTKNLVLNLLTRDETLAMIEALSPAERAEVSSDWLAELRTSDSIDPWRHGFSMVHRETGDTVGKCCFKGPPLDGIVEIAYGIEHEYRCKGYAT